MQESQRQKVKMRYRHHCELKVSKVRAPQVPKGREVMLRMIGREQMVSN